MFDPESVLSSIRPSSAPISVAQQPKVNISVGKVAANGENGGSGGSDVDGKQSSSHEDSNFQDWYETLLIQDI